MSEKGRQRTNKPRITVLPPGPETARFQSYAFDASLGIMKTWIPARRLVGRDITIAGRLFSTLYAAGDILRASG